MLDATPGFGLGSVAGKGRNKKAPSTVPAVPTGTRMALAKKTIPARMALFIGKCSVHAWPGCSVHHGISPDQPAPRLPDLIYSLSVRPPSVDALARELADIELPHPLLVDAARAAIAAAEPSSARERAERMRLDLLRPVVNATGVLLHTNLGRAPLAHSQPATY